MAKCRKAREKAFRKRKNKKGKSCSSAFSHGFLPNMAPNPQPARPTVHLAPPSLRLFRSRINRFYPSW
jgi:hypothetical protein